MISFLNCLNEQLRIELYKKDVTPDSVTELLGNSFAVSYPTGNGDKFDTIITCEAKISITLYPDDAITFVDLIVTFPDEWKVIAYDDNQVVFVGFLTPGEGRADFQDKPYDLNLSAVDGIGLLKGTPLTRTNGDNFTGVNLIIDYILAILSKTGLDLNLRLFSNITESSMQDRTQNPNADTFNQTGLHARTFLKNSVEFNDCYTCLERILIEYFAIYQHNGKWVILRIGELQDSIGAKMWYTEYNSSGTIVRSAQYLENAAGNGRDRLIHPVELSQFISSNFAMKSTRYTYNYNVWPEIPTNNNFQRGTVYESGVATDDFDTDGDGDVDEVVGTYYKYTIDNWEQGIIDYFDIPHPAMTPTPHKFWRETYINTFGVEIENYIKSDTDDNDTVHSFWLRSEGIPVNSGDRVEIGMSKRFANDFSSTSSTVFTLAMTVYLVSGGNAYLLTNGNDGEARGFWKRATVNLGQGNLIINYAPNQKTNTWSSLSVLSEPIPANGTLYIAFESNGPSSNTGAFQYIKDFSFTYHPYILGGYLPLKGDYAQTSQNANFKDTISDEVFISDSPKQVFQGALYRANLTDLTNNTWHRFGVNENRHFKELGELARFNANYRRMWKMEGQYDGLKFTPADNPTFIEPISFHRQFIFPDQPLLNGHYFVLVPPLTLTYSEGRADMNFVEVLQDGSQDGRSQGDSHIPLQYIFE
jgi:hypothetical protein